MKLIANVEKKTLRILENERSIFCGEYGADKLELYINKQLENEYPTITALLSNGRKIGAYSTDDAYSIEEIDGEQYTKATFTLSKENGFTLSEGKMQITIWMNSITGSKQALGNVILNVINTTAFDDGDIIISGDVEGTLVNYRVELENLQGQVNTFNGRITNAERDIAYNLEHITILENNKADKTEIPTKLSQLEQDVGVISLGEIDDPNDVNNEILNAVTDSGVYTFTTTESYSGGYYLNTNVYFMVVERTDTEGRAVEQFIYSCDVPRDHTSTLSNLTIIRRIKSKTSGTWVVKSIVIPSQEYVDKKIAKLISEEVDSSPETLNTLKELADALQENDSVVEALNSAIGNKANKDEVPTKLSDLTIDVELGVSEEQVAEMIDNAITRVLNEEV